jgi:hypothetical protein
MHYSQSAQIIAGLCVVFPYVCNPSILYYKKTDYAFLQAFFYFFLTTVTVMANFSLAFPPISSPLCKGWMGWIGIR